MVAPCLQIDILTLFPGMFPCVLNESILRRAIERELVAVRVHNIRDWATDKHRVTDDYPYGGGAGMVMKPEPLFAAIEATRGDDGYVVLMTPQGELLTQAIAQELATRPHLVLVCGHYEGVDERVRLYAVDRELSTGDYVLTGGELPAMVAMDAVIRLVPGVLGGEQTLAEESFASGLLEYPQYTRPAEFRNWRVPDILLSGHHAAIARWRRQEALRRTRDRRPDLLARAQAMGLLSTEDLKLLAEIDSEG